MMLIQRRYVLFCCVVLMGILSPVVWAEAMILGVDTPQLIAATMEPGVTAITREVWQRGVRFTLYRDGDKANYGLLSIGVLPSPAEAIAALEQQVHYTSIAPTLQLTYGEKCALWPGKQDTRIDFVRRNVLVSLHIPSERASETAQKIDNAIQQGLNGVKVGEALSLPQITNIIIPETITAGTEVVIPFTVLDSNLAILQSVGFTGDAGVPDSTTPLLETADQVTINCIAHYHAPRINEPKQRIFACICYATPACVLVTKQIYLTVVQKDN